MYVVLFLCIDWHVYIGEINPSHYIDVNTNVQRDI